MQNTALNVPEEMHSTLYFSGKFAQMEHKLYACPAITEKSMSVHDQIFL